MGQQDHKHAQANTKQVRFPSCCSRISKPLLSRLRANFCQDWKALSISTSPQSTSLYSVLWSFPERFTYFKETPHTTKAYQEPLYVGSGEFGSAKSFFKGGCLVIFLIDLSEIWPMTRGHRMCAWIYFLFFKLQWPTSKRVDDICLFGASLWIFLVNSRSTVLFF